MSEEFRTVYAPLWKVMPLLRPNLAGTCMSDEQEAAIYRAAAHSFILSKSLVLMVTSTKRPGVFKYECAFLRGAIPKRAEIINDEDKSLVFLAMEIAE